MQVPPIGAALVLAAVLAAAIAPLRAGAQESAPPSLMILFDGSGSMWGKINGSPLPKFGAAREALRQTLPALSPATRTGLAGFGHRRRGDCTDVETMVPLEAADPLRFMPLLEKLNPKGKGPLAQGLRQAASVLAASPGEKHLLVLHDEPDNCQQDVCAAAAEIHAADPAIRIHVVTVGMAPSAAQPLACMAAQTGGTMFATEDAGELPRAIQTALAAIGRPAAPPARAAPAPTPAAPASPASPAAAATAAPATLTTPPAPPELPADGPSRVRLDMRLAGSAIPIDGAVRWRLTRLEATAGTGTAIERLGARHEIEIPEGRWRIDAAIGAVTQSKEITVKAAGVSDGRLEVPAALVRLDVTARRGSGTLTPAMVTIRRGGPTGEVLWLGQSGETVAVPPGQLHVRVEEGAAAAETALAVSAGAAQPVEIALEAGQLRVTASAREGGPPLDDIVFRVLEESPEAAAGVREIARSSAPSPTFVLPAGAYLVSARSGAIELRERTIVRPGEESTRALVLAGGRLRLTLKPGDPDAAQATMVTASRLDPADPATQTLSPARPLAELAPGRYRIDARIGSQNARLVREVEIKPGAEVTLPVDIPAARVELKLAAGGLASADMVWEVADRTGAVVWRSMVNRPRGWLAPGRYEARLTGRDRVRTAGFEVRAGDKTVIEVAP